MMYVGCFLPNSFLKRSLNSDQWWPEMKICRVELPNAEVSDTTGDDSRPDAGYKKSL